MLIIFNHNKQNKKVFTKIYNKIDFLAKRNHFQCVLFLKFCGYKFSRSKASKQYFLIISRTARNLI